MQHARQLRWPTEKENMPARVMTKPRVSGLPSPRKMCSHSGTAGVTARDKDIQRQKLEISTKATRPTNATKTIAYLQHSLASANKELSVAHNKVKLYYSLLRNERRKAARAKAAAAQASVEVQKLQGDLIPNMQRQAAAHVRRLVKESTAQIAALEKCADSSASDIYHLPADLAETRKKVRALQMRVLRVSRALGRVLVAKGHMESKTSPAKRLLQRAVLEGGVAAKVQLGVEMMATEK
ncbi:uncharacterized protein F5891DRAFT_1201483 [Suillus fuscotomentosus]|uniref:Uncharacterized protein n=1 Tax=Suillus fuscotomentosus TaxID=1912939 RepID=A0AAD4DNF4_9AGAM|nr:uncharacterized protein F5891DRAFT_1201483 [Suillus fuscotomentosus]KAG1885886.1 hypothetical protein F5891DRAFT_1201483 [Suillus fuscotomentosus]